MTIGETGPYKLNQNPTVHIYVCAICLHEFDSVSLCRIHINNMHNATRHFDVPLRVPVIFNKSTVSARAIESLTNSIYLNSINYPSSLQPLAQQSEQQEQEDEQQQEQQAEGAGEEEEEEVEQKQQLQQQLKQEQEEVQQQEQEAEQQQQQQQQLPLKQEQEEEEEEEEEQQQQEQEQEQQQEVEQQEEEAPEQQPKANINVVGAASAHAPNYGVNLTNQLHSIINRRFHSQNPIRFVTSVKKVDNELKTLVDSLSATSIINSNIAYRRSKIVVSTANNVVSASVNILLVPFNKETNQIYQKHQLNPNEPPPKQFIVILAPPPSETEPKTEADAPSTSTTTSASTSASASVSNALNSNINKRKPNDIYKREKLNQTNPVTYKNFCLVLRKDFKEICDYNESCNLKFESVAQMNIHKLCHPVENGYRFECPACRMNFDYWRHCSQHLMKIHQIDVDLLQCPVCTFKSHSSVIIWRHMRAHKKWRSSVLNTLCQMVKKHPSMAAQVINKTQPPKKERYYAQKVCVICNRKFASGKTLSKHVKTVHNKIKPFNCNVCGMKTARKASLIIHMRQHTGERPLNCNKCEFATRDPSVLHKHQLRHNDEMQFLCPKCDYGSIQANAYKKHLQVKHPEEYRKVACNMCRFVTISVERLEAHKEDHRRGLVKSRDDLIRADTSAGFPGGGNLCGSIDQNCFDPEDSVDSLPQEPAVDTGGVTIPAPIVNEEAQFAFDMAQ